MRCMVCLMVLNGDTGWVRNPDGATACWPCYEAGKMPPVPVDLYADQEPPAAIPKPKRKQAKRREMNEVWDK